MTDEYLKFIKDCINKGEINKFYKRKEWRAKRAEVLELDHYECQMCRKIKNKYTKAQCVHHVNHLEEYPEYAFEIYNPITNERNLVSLCNECHNQVHPEKHKHFQTNKEKFKNEERW